MQVRNMRLTRVAGMAAMLAVLAPLAVLAQDAAQPAAGGPSAAELNPLGLGMARQHAESFVPGKPLEVAVTISAATAGEITAMGLRETLPPDWRLETVGVDGGAPPDIVPAPGTAGVLEFAWIAIPQFPYTFTYAVMPPEGDSGTKTINGALEYRQTGGSLHAAPVLTEVRGPDTKPVTITLKGDNPVMLNVGDPWEEPGYTALDGKNQDITGKVVVHGKVDTGRAVQYEITYTVAADNGQRASTSRTVVVKEKSDSQAAPTTDGTGPAPVHAPAPLGQSGRERSNPIAASVDKNPANQDQDATTPTATTAEGEAVAAIKKPELPDLSAFRPPPTAQPDDKPQVPAQPGTATATPTLPGTPTAAIAPVAHRAPVPKEMLKAGALKEKAGKAAAGAASIPKPSASVLPKVSTQAVAVVVAVGAVVLGGLCFLGWRLVYNRPIRRKPRIQESGVRSQDETKAKGKR